jgi:hypothetical protein
LNLVQASSLGLCQKAVQQWLAGFASYLEMVSTSPAMRFSTLAQLSMAALAKITGSAEYELYN